MLSWGFVKHRIDRKSFKKAMALIVAIAFLFNASFQDLAWATIDEDSLLTPSSKGGPVGPAKFNLVEFVLPSYLGHAENLTIGASGKTVLHIQDAHCNYEAQKAIYRLIEYLNKSYDVKLINLEGGIGAYDLSPFTDIPDLEIRWQVAEYFLKEGRINGAEFFAINNPDLVTLWGVDSRKWYFKNLYAYRNFIPSRTSVDRNISALKKLFFKLKKRIYSAELFDFEEHCQEFNKNKSDFKGYITYLTEIAESKNINTKNLKNINALTKMLSLEDGIDFKETNRERERLIDELEKRLSRIEREELVLKAVAFKMTAISQKDFYAYLKKKSDEARIDVGTYPNLARYIGYIYIYGAIDNRELFDEIARLEERIKESMFQNAIQRELALYSRCFNTFDKLLNIRATRSDYDFFREKGGNIDMAEIIKYVQTQCEKLEINYYLDKDVFGLKHNLNDIASFYDYANKRDIGIIENTLNKMKESNQFTSVVITGGFHTENLKELFGELGISYLSIIPNFKENNVPNKYFERLAGRPSPIEEYVLDLIHRHGPDIKVIPNKSQRREESTIATPSPLSADLRAAEVEVVEGYLKERIGIEEALALRKSIEILEQLDITGKASVDVGGEVTVIFSRTSAPDFVPIEGVEGIYVKDLRAEEVTFAQSVRRVVVSSFMKITTPIVNAVNRLRGRKVIEPVKTEEPVSPATGRIVGGEAGERVIGVEVDLIGLDILRNISFGPEGRYVIDETGQVMGIPVYIAPNEWFETRGIKRDGVVVAVVDENGNVSMRIVVREGAKDISSTLYHELIAALSLSGAVDVTTEIEPVHLMAEAAQVNDMMTIEALQKIGPNLTVIVAVEQPIIEEPLQAVAEMEVPLAQVAQVLPEALSLVSRGIAPQLANAIIVALQQAGIDVTETLLIEQILPRIAQLETLQILPGAEPLVAYGYSIPLANVIVIALEQAGVRVTPVLLTEQIAPRIVQFQTQQALPEAQPLVSRGIAPQLANAIIVALQQAGIEVTETLLIEQILPRIAQIETRQILPGAEPLVAYGYSIPLANAIITALRQVKVSITETLLTELAPRLGQELASRPVVPVEVSQAPELIQREEDMIGYIQRIYEASKLAIQDIKPGPYVIFISESKFEDIAVKFGITTAAKRQVGREYNFGDITVKVIQKDLSDLKNAYEAVRNELERPNAVGIAFLDQEFYEQGVQFFKEQGVLAEIRPGVPKMTLIKEIIPQDGYVSILGHIILGIGLLDYTINDNIDNLIYVSNLIRQVTLKSDIAETFRSNPQSLLKGSFALVLPRITEKEVWNKIEVFIGREEELAVAL